MLVFYSSCPNYGGKYKMTMKKNNIQAGILPNAQCHLNFIVVSCDLR